MYRMFSSSLHLIWYNKGGKVFQGTIHCLMPRVLWYDVNFGFGAFCSYIRTRLCVAAFGTSVRPYGCSCNFGLFEALRWKSFDVGNDVKPECNWSVLQIWRLSVDRGCLATVWDVNIYSASVGSLTIRSSTICSCNRFKPAQKHNNMNIAYCRCSRRPILIV